MSREKLYEYFDSLNNEELAELLASEIDCSHCPIKDYCDNSARLLDACYSIILNYLEEIED